jgi:hypothetical protein
MPARLRLLSTAASAVLVATLSVATTGVATAARATDPTPVPLSDWAAKFCTSFATYETDALAAQAKLQTAFAGVKDSTEGATTTGALADVFTKASTSAQAAATAATANGVPDVAHGAALAQEIDGTLADASKAYAKVAKKSSSLPTAPKKLSQAAKKISGEMADALDPTSAHAKRLKKLDTKNAVAKAISSDPTCAAAANASGTTTPAQSTPTTSTP